MPSAEGCPEAAWLVEQEWDVTGFEAADQAVALALEDGRKAGVHTQAQITGPDHFDKNY